MISPRAEVSILIPAFMAETFIDRTLQFAKGQTCRDILIVVSVDAGSDNTAQIVRAHAAEDARIVLHPQPQRLGWVGNVNYLLERVDTPYFFLYFHDDMLLPQYTEVLLEVLKGHPESVGAYCDMGHFGATEHVSRGPEYRGSVVERLLTLMLAPERGSPLRAMLRTANAGQLRLPDLGGGGFWANEPFLMEMLSAGPLEHIPRVLYRRWDRRQGGLTDAWRNLPPEDIADAWRSNVAARLEIIARATSDTGERNALTAALYLQVFPVLRQLRDVHGRSLFPTAASVHPQLVTHGIEALFAGHGSLIAGWARERLKLCQA